LPAVIVGYVGLGVVLFNCCQCFRVAVGANPIVLMMDEIFMVILYATVFAGACLSIVLSTNWVCLLE
jgi:hypothetical protein